ncbi:MAG: purine-cytosine permease family protein [Nocardioidaceae bacterium]
MVTEQRSTGSALAVEQNGINVIDESERKGTPRDLFWPWCAANISVLGIGYGSFLLYTGANFWQALVFGTLGTVFSFVLVGLVSLAGTRGSAPTMVLSRAGFGVRGNGLPAFVSWLLLVGWETVLVSLATLATSTVFRELGWSDGNVTKVVAFLVVVVVIIGAGVLGFDAIMRLQTWLTVVLAVMTVGYIGLTVDDVDWATVSALPAAGAAPVVGALILAMTGFGIGWVNAGADYSRYLPRTAGAGAVAGWTTFGAAVAPVLLVLYGLLLAGSDPGLRDAIALDPIGALTALLPTWYLVPFAVVAIGGLIGGAVLDIYSSGLTLLTLGLRVPRWTAALLDGILMVLGTIYFVWVADNFLFPFQGFLITLGVPIAAWCGIFLADLSTRREPYAEADLYDAGGRYGAVNPVAVGALVVATAVGWGLVINTFSKAFAWEGYLLGPVGLGGRDGTWGAANLGVLVALLLAFVLQRWLGAPAVRRQEGSA